MKDIVFYPIVIVLIGCSIVFALSFGGGYATVDERQIAEVGYVVEGEYLSRLTSAPGTSYDIAGDANNPAAYAVLAAHMTQEQAGASAGVFATLGPAYEKALAGQTVRIAVRARKGRSNPSDSFQVGYFTAGAGDSEWQSFDLGQDFEDYSFTFRPGLPEGDPGNDYLGIWPDPSGDSGTIDVERMTVKIVK